jgi:hypothetical protein
VERGRRAAKQQFIDGCERELNAGGVLKAVQDDVDRTRLPARFRDFAKWEKDAASLYSYAPLVIPGLLQTDAYARTLIEGRCPPLDKEMAEERIAARIDRRAIFEQDRGVITGFVIEEWVLRRPVGGPSVMREQLDWLLAMGERPNVAIQVMPTAQWRHPGFYGAITLLETMDGRIVAYTESGGLSAVITDHRKVRIQAQRHGMIRMQALDTAESARIIEELVEAL